MRAQGVQRNMTDVDVLQALKDDSYRWGDLQCLRYDKANRELFSDAYIGYLYARCVASRRRSGNGILDQLFGGNPASDFPSIVTYLAQRPVLLILGKWVDGKFNELGFAFPTVSIGAPNTEKSLIAGYGFFAPSWGTQDQRIVTMLGLAYFFKEFGLSAIIGNRYRENVLTAKYMARFGFKDYGEIPRLQLQGAKLVPMVVSALLREDFEEVVKTFLVEQYRRANEQPEPDVLAIEARAEEKRRQVVVRPEPVPIPPDPQKLTVVEAAMPVGETAKKTEEPYLPLNWI